MPSTNDEISRHVSEFAEAGMDGGISSVDATNVVLWNCTYAQSLVFYFSLRLLNMVTNFFVYSAVWFNCLLLLLLDIHTYIILIQSRLHY